MPALANAMWCLKIDDAYYCGEEGSYLHERVRFDGDQRMALRWADRNTAVHNAWTINHSNRRTLLVADARVVKLVTPKRSGAR